MKFLPLILAAVAALTLAAPASADPLTCSDARDIDGTGARFRWDELPATSSQLYLNLEACSCGTPTWTGGPAATLGPCSSECSFTDGSGDWGCGLSAPVCDPALDPACDYWSYYVWTQQEADACNSCIADTCGALSLACWLDGVTS